MVRPRGIDTTPPAAMRAVAELRDTLPRLDAALDLNDDLEQADAYGRRVDELFDSVPPALRTVVRDALRELDPKAELPWYRWRLIRRCLWDRSLRCDDEGATGGWCAFKACALRPG